MKNKFILPFFAVLFALISCVSRPKETDMAAAAGQTAGQNELISLNNSRERAAGARQLALDFHAPAYNPSEWETAESLLSNAEASNSSASQEEIFESSIRFNTAAEGFQTAAELAIAQYAVDQEAVLEDARERAVKAGAENAAGDYLLQADNAAADILPPWEAKKYYEAQDALFNAVNSYSALETGLDAYNLRIKLQERGFDQYDPDKMNGTDEIWLSAVEDYKAGNIIDARSKAEIALENYLEFEAQWIGVYAGQAAEKAETERQRALSIRSDISARFEFEAGDAFYSQGKIFIEEDDFYKASDSLDRAINQFSSSYRLTMQRRRLAEEALVEVDYRLEESDENARRAEEIIGGGIE